MAHLLRLKRKARTTIWKIQLFQALHLIATKQKLPYAAYQIVRASPTKFSVQSLTQFEIPALSFIGARGFVKWMAEGDAGQGRNHVSFSLDGEGEALRISSAVIPQVPTYQVSP